MNDVIEAKPKTVNYVPDPHDPEHYVPLINRPGEFVWLPKRELKVDHTYQRVLNQQVINRITQNWNWVACGTLIISMRQNGSYFIIDGGHRHAAALELREIRELPCLVFELSSVTAEAIGFLSANSDRKQIGPMAAFKAELLTGSARALIVDELAREAGRSVGQPSDKTHLSCVSAIQRYARIDKAALRRVWPLVTELCLDAPLPSWIVHALWATERRMPYGQSLTDDRWRARLMRAGMINLERDVRGAVALGGNRNERTCSAGIVTAINSGLKSGKLRLREGGMR